MSKYKRKKPMTFIMGFFLFSVVYTVLSTRLTLAQRQQ